MRGMTRVFLFIVTTTLNISLLVLMSGCSDPQEKPITAKQTIKLHQLLAVHVELQDMYTAANSDGIITNKEYLDILYQMSISSNSNTE